MWQPPDNTQPLGNANQPPGRPDDGTSPAVYFDDVPTAETKVDVEDLAHRVEVLEEDLARRVEVLEQGHKQLIAKVPDTHTGVPHQIVKQVRETLPRGGFRMHDVSITHDGFGRYRVDNMTPDAPHHATLDGAKEFISRQKFEGPIEFGTMDETKGWVSEE